jgi:hypothetical protein
MDSSQQRSSTTEVNLQMQQKSKIALAGSLLDDAGDAL